METRNSGSAILQCRYLQNDNVETYNKNLTAYSSISETIAIESTINNRQNRVKIDDPTLYQTSSKCGNIMDGSSRPICSSQNNKGIDSFAVMNDGYNEEILSSYSNSRGREEHSSPNITPSISMSYIKYTQQQQYNLNDIYGQQNVIYPIKAWSIISSPSLLTPSYTFCGNISSSNSNNMYQQQQQQSNIDNMTETETETLKNEAFRIKPVNVDEFNKMYPLDKQIGSGGDGMVYLVRNDPNIIVKQISFHNNMEELSSTSMEADILKKTGIGELKAAYFQETDNNNNNNNILYKIYEKYEYDLFQYVSQCNKCAEIIDDHQIRDIIKNICGEINKLHQHHYIHNDIKPHNIMKREKEKVMEWKLIDFDRITKLSDIGNVIIGNRGSRGWTAPEIKTAEYWEESNVATKKTDIWCIGLVIIYLVRRGNIGRLQYKENGFNQWYNQCFIYNKMHLLEIDDLYKNGLIGEVLKDLLCGILEEDTQKRLNMEQTLKHKWFQMNDDGVNNGYIDQDIIKETMVNYVKLGVIHEYKVNGHHGNDRTDIDDKCHVIQENMDYNNNNDNFDNELLMNSKVIEYDELLRDSMAMEFDEYNSSLIIQENKLKQDIDIKYKEIGLNIIDEMKGDDVLRVIKEYGNDQSIISTMNDNGGNEECNIMDTRNINDVDTKQDSIKNITTNDNGGNNKEQSDDQDNEDNDISIEREYEYEYDYLLKGSKPIEFEQVPVLHRNEMDIGCNPYRTIDFHDKYENEENENRLKIGNEYDLQRKYC